jgi:hypothetical protein
MLAVARATAALFALIGTLWNARSGAPEYFTSSEPAHLVATLRQTGETNRLQVRQAGSGHRAVIDQTGANNSIDLPQTGVANNFDALQSGSGNTAWISQR